MALKRAFFEDDDGYSFLGQEQQQPKKRSPTFKNAVTDVMNGILLDGMAARLEPFIRTWVREETERVVLNVFSPTARTSLNHVETSEGRGFQLRFANNLPATIFTGSKIEAEDGGQVRIELIDAFSQTVVTSGPYSSLKIEIVVLDGDFGSDEQENWTSNQFIRKVVREREGKRPLVTGELTVTLKDGVGVIGDLSFTDNSSWIRCRKFRLGAVVQRVRGEERIKEARSEAFVVKDHRGELYKKHYPPSLDDEIWRLERIAKDGTFHTRLASCGVHTLKDFLRLHTIDPIALRNMLGGPNRTWDTIVEHANTCVLDHEKFFAYFGEAEGVGLLFNSVYKLVAATFDGQNYQSLDKLTFHQKLLVQSLKKRAYDNVNNFVLIDARTIFGPARPLTSLPAEPFTDPSSGLRHPEFPVTRQMVFNNVASTSYRAEDSHQLQFSVHPTLRNSFSTGDFFPIPGENRWSPPQSGSEGQIVPHNHLSAEDINALLGQNNGFCFAASSSDSEPGLVSSLPSWSHVHISRKNGKPKAAWTKIRAAIMWGSVRRDLAAKRIYGNPFSFSYKC